MNTEIGAAHVHSSITADEKVSTEKLSTESDEFSSPVGWGAKLTMAVGGLLTGGLIVTALAAGMRTSEDYQLQQVATSEIAAASQSLIPAQAAALIEQAKACRAPLAFLSVRATGAAKGNVRFRSGTYVSPNLQLGPRLDRIALPYPAPHVVGHGQITVESNIGGADVFLTPGTHIGAGQRSTVINVRWNPDAPC